MKFVVFLVLAFYLVSCENYSQKELENFDSQIKNYIDSAGLDMKKTQDGLYYNIINEGIGDKFIGFNDYVTFRYKGYFLNGNSFQVIDENNPLKYRVNQLIVGWQDALMMLKNKGEIQLIIPPQLAFKKRKTELIPQNSILVYHLWVINAE